MNRAVVYIGLFTSITLFAVTVSAQLSAVPFNGGNGEGSAVASSIYSEADSCYFTGSILPDTLIDCSYESTILDGSVYFAENYFWSTGDTTPVIAVDSSGWYSVESSFGNCAITDSVYVWRSSEPLLSVVISDASSPEIADGFIAVDVLSATFPIDVYWIPGPNDYLLDSILPGWYQFFLVDAVGCTFQDSFYVNYDTCYLHYAVLPEDTLRLCPGDSLLLVNQYDAVSGYLWSTEDTTKQIWVYESGWYGLELTWSGCGSSIDSVFVDDAEPILGSVLSIPASDSLHPDGSLIFTPDPLLSDYSYLWSNGDADSLAEELSPGYYEILVTDSYGCNFSFSGAVDTGICFHYYFDLGPDTSGCAGNAIVLSPVGTASGNYLWSDSSTNSVLSVLVPDTVFLTISDSICSYSDTVLVAADVLPGLLIDVIPASRPINADGAIELTFLEDDPENFMIAWSTGSSGTAISGLDTGYYSFTLTDTSGCSFFESLYLDFDSCYLPYGIYVSDTTNTSFRVSWTGPEIASYVAFYRNLTTGGGFTSIPVPEGETSVDIPALLGQQIKYKIKFACAGTVSESPLITFNMPEDSVLRVAENSTIHVWPNPFENDLYVTTDKEISWIITDLFGQIHRQGWITAEGSFTTIDTRWLPSGVYILILKSDQSMHTVQLIHK